MSSLSQFAPFAGGGLKSFQTGFVGSSFGYVGTSFEDSYFVDVTISSVSTTKSIPAAVGSSFTQPYGAATRYGYIYRGGVSFVCWGMPRLTSATNLRIASALNGDVGTLQYSYRWQVAEAN